MKIAIVLGCGYGDEGKGLMTDYLVRRFHSPETTTVVRFSGGQQAGHTVVTDSDSHVFANYGAGSLAGASSYFSEHCTFYPPNILNEREALLAKGGNVDLMIHPLANLTTHWDIAYNKALESLRKMGKNHHGSCGMGIGATIERNTLSPYRIYAADLMYPSLLKQKLMKVFDYYDAKINEHPHPSFFHSFTSFAKELEADFMRSIEAKVTDDVISIADYSALRTPRCSNVVFEGSQGILLDMDHGLFPNVTRTNTTSKNAFHVLNRMGIDLHNPAHSLSTYYMTRCYQTRHGAGWFSNDEGTLSFEDTTNTPGDWQEKLRFAEFNYEALKYAIVVDAGYQPTLSRHVTQRNLVFTHLDQRPDWKIDRSQISELGLSYLFGSFGPKAIDIRAIDNDKTLQYEGTNTDQNLTTSL